MELVIDASAFVKLLDEEPGSLRTDELATRADTLLAPDWMVVESAMALWKKARRGLLTTDEALDALADGERYPVELVATQQLLPEALALACELPHPLYDTIYLVLALHGGRTLATADARMREAAQALGVRVEWVGTEG
jgi:predicted nucleic acid-binding protein